MRANLPVLCCRVRLHNRIDLWSVAIIPRSMPLLFVFLIRVSLFLHVRVGVVPNLDCVCYRTPVASARFLDRRSLLLQLQTPWSVSAIFLWAAWVYFASQWSLFLRLWLPWTPFSRALSLAKFIVLSHRSSWTKAFQSKDIHSSWTLTRTDRPQFWCRRCPRRDCTVLLLFRCDFWANLREGWLRMMRNWSDVCLSATFCPYISGDRRSAFCWRLIGRWGCCYCCCVWRSWSFAWILKIKRINRRGWNLLRYIESLGMFLFWSIAWYAKEVKRYSLIIQLA